jgi:hypothetical protein
MTVGEWLAARRPTPPDALRSHLADALGADVELAAAETTSACLAAAERLTATLLASTDTSRASALDLLTADALVTYAFESASEHPADLGRRAAEAMRRIASLAAPV